MYRRVNANAMGLDTDILSEQYMASWTAAARGRGLSNAALVEAFEIVLEYY